jgi:hypothetical protein
VEDMAVRTWKSDGSQNLMSVKVAALNIQSNTKDPKVMRMKTSEIAELLLCGRALETPFAVFSCY